MFQNRQFWDHLAIESYKAILKKKPKSALIHNNLGLAYSRIGKLNKAIRSFQRAIKMDASSIEPYYHLGTAFQQIGKQTEALRAFANYNKFSANSQPGNTIVPELIARLKRGTKKSS